MMNDEPNIITIVVQSYLIGDLKGKLSDVITKFQSYLLEVPEEFRDAVRIDITETYPDMASNEYRLVYDRLETEEELDARLDKQDRIRKKWPF